MQVEAPLKILRRREKVICLHMADMHGIKLALCMPMILMEEGRKSSVQSQRELKIVMNKVV